MFNRHPKTGQPETAETLTQENKPDADHKKKKKPPEKRLFHKPITISKVTRYVLLALLLAAVVITGRFLYVTVINGRAAFPDSTPVPAVTQTAETASSAGTPVAIETYSPEELLAMQADMDFMKDRVNVLITGIDYSPEREGREDFRTDTILLMSVNFATGQADMISVPRDSYADIAFTDRKWKINGAFMSAGGAEGEGFECLMQTVSDTLGGIPINYYIAVEMPAVKEIVDIIGGVWYDVDHEINMDGRHLDTGYQLLDGQAVLDYCRARKGITSGTDIDRIVRQQQLLMTVFTQMKNTSLLQDIPEIYQNVQPEVYTNLNFEQIVSLTLFALDLDLDSESQWYKLKGKYMEAYHSSYYVLDHTYTQEIISEIFGIEPDIDWHYSINYVKKVTATSNLDEAIQNLSSLVSDNQDILTTEQIQGAQSMISSANAILAEQNTNAMNEATENVSAMYTTLNNYVKNPPEPTLSPSPTADPAATSGPAAAPTPDPAATVTPDPVATTLP